MADDLVTVSAWRKLAAGQGWGKFAEIRTWAGLDLEPRFNMPGTWSLRLPFNEQSARLEKPHLLTFDFRGTRMTGVIEKFGAASDDTGRPLIEVSGLDAMVILGDALGWPSPAAPIGEQTEVRWYRTGPAETVLRDLIQANLVDRLGYELALPASQGRGATVTVNSQFDNVLATVSDKATLAGLGVEVGLVNTTSSTRAANTVRFYPLRDRSRRVRLSHKVGTLRSWKAEDSSPTATRAIIAAAREQQGRQVETVNVGASRITTKPAKHRLRTGNIITFTGGTPPAPLELGMAYHAVRVDADTFQVALTRSDAAAGVVVTLTDAGAGTITVTEQTRRHRQVTAPDAEAEWGRVKESFIAANGEDKNSALDEQGTQSLMEAAAQSAFELETTEAEGMRYGAHYGLGDDVTVELVTGVSKVERVGAVKVSASADSGLSVQVVPGNPDATNPLFGQAAAFRALRRQANRAQED